MTHDDPRIDETNDRYSEEFRPVIDRFVNARVAIAVQTFFVEHVAEVEDNRPTNSELKVKYREALDSLITDVTHIIVDTTEEEICRRFAAELLTLAIVKGGRA